MTRPTRANAAGRAYLDLQNKARRERPPTQELMELYVLEGRQAVLAPLSEALQGYAEMAQVQWAARARRQQLDDRLPSQFANLLDDVCAFSDPPIRREASGRRWDHLGLSWSGIQTGS